MASPEEVQKLAALSRISIPEEKLETFAREFDGMLAYVGKLDELALPSRTERSIPAVRNVMREDGEAVPGGTNTKNLTDAFPDRDGDSLKVKQIISYD